MAVGLQLAFDLKDNASAAFEKSASKIGGDTKQMATDQERALAKSNRGWRGFVDTVGGAKIAMGLAAAGAVTLASSMVKMALDVSKSGDQLHKMSIRTGTSVETLSALSHAADLSGSDLGTLERALRGATEKIKTLETGSPGLVEQFEALGLSTKTAAGEMKSLDQLMLDTADIIAGMEDATEQATAATTVFGRSGTDILPLLEQGSDGIRGMMEEAHGLGRVMSTENAEASAKLQDELTRLAGVMEGIKLNLLTPVIPLLTSTAEGFRSIVSAVGRFVGIPESEATRTREFLAAVKALAPDAADATWELAGGIAAVGVAASTVPNEPPKWITDPGAWLAGIEAEEAEVTGTLNAEPMWATDPGGWLAGIESPPAIPAGLDVQLPDVDFSGFRAEVATVGTDVLSVTDGVGGMLDDFAARVAASLDAVRESATVHHDAVAIVTADELAAKAEALGIDTEQQTVAQLRLSTEQLIVPEIQSATTAQLQLAAASRTDVDARKKAYDKAKQLRDMQLATAVVLADSILPTVRAFTSEGKGANQHWRDFANTVLPSVISQLIQAAIKAKLVSAALGPFSGAIGGIGGALIGSLFHGGGVAGAPSRARAIPASALGGAPRYHSGLAPDETVAILQRGEPVLSRDQARAAKDAGLLSIDSRGKPQLHAGGGGGRPAVSLQIGPVYGSAEFVDDYLMPQLEDRLARQGFLVAEEGM